MIFYAKWNSGVLKFVSQYFGDNKRNVASDVKSNINIIPNCMEQISGVFQPSTTTKMYASFLGLGLASNPMCNISQMESLNHLQLFSLIPIFAIKLLVVHRPHPHAGKTTNPIRNMTITATCLMTTCRLFYKH